VKASTLEKINGRMQREINSLKRSVHKADQATAKAKEQLSFLETRYQDTVVNNGELLSRLELARADLASSKRELQHVRGVWYRVGSALESLLKNWVERKKQRLTNWFLIKRLNKPRVEAVTEAGYVPAKLIKLAHKYWEYDQKRLEHDEQIVYQSGTDYTHYSRPPGFWRRIKIRLGRA
jgi:chromosome segregation ATPase